MTSYRDYLVRQEIILAAVAKAAQAGEPCPKNEVLGELIGVKFNSVPGILDRLVDAGAIRVQRFQSARIVEIVATGARTATPPGRGLAHVGMWSRQPRPERELAPAPAPEPPAPQPVAVAAPRPAPGTYERTPRSLQMHHLSMSARYAGQDPMRRAFGDIGPAPRSCRFPMWPDDAEKPTHEYCGEPVVEAGKPYCAEHQARCWTRRVPAFLKVAT